MLCYNDLLSSGDFKLGTALFNLFLLTFLFLLFMLIRFCYLQIKICFLQVVLVFSFQKWKILDKESCFPLVYFSSSAPVLFLFSSARNIKLLSLSPSPPLHPFSLIHLLSSIGKINYLSPPKNPIFFFKPQTSRVISSISYFQIPLLTLPIFSVKLSVFPFIFL